VPFLLGGTWKARTDRTISLTVTLQFRKCPLLATPANMAGVTEVSWSSAVKYVTPAIKVIFLRSLWRFSDWETANELQANYFLKNIWCITLTQLTLSVTFLSFRLLALIKAQYSFWIHLLFFTWPNRKSWLKLVIFSNCAQLSAFNEYDCPNSDVHFCLRCLS